MADRLFTSNQTDEILSALRYETKLEKASLARIAFTLSLTSVGAEVPACTDFGGGEMKRPTFIGSDELFIRSLIASVHRTPDLSEDDFFSNKSIIKNHIDNGSQILHQMFVELGRDTGKLIDKLVKCIEFDVRNLVYCI